MRISKPQNKPRPTHPPLLQNEKVEFSLSKALKDHMIGLYINLPSRNKFRRPASFMSRGYLTRRMAVDHQVCAGCGPLSVSLLD